MRIASVICAVSLLGTVGLRPLGQRHCGAVAHRRETGAGKEEHRKLKRNRHRKLSHAADWALFFFHPEVREITGVEIIWGRFNETKWTIESKDPQVLKTLHRAFLMPKPLRLAVPDDGTIYGSTGGTCFAVIRVKTTDGQFIIGVNDSGFALNEREVNLNNVFFSWLLAKQFDELVFAKTGKHVDKRRFDHLSGEWYLQINKGTWKKLHPAASEEEK